MPTESSDLNKISKLETQFHEMHVELKVINSNLTGINDTLKEFKQINRSLSEIKTEQALAKQASESSNAKLGILFKKFDTLDVRMKKIETGDTKQELKLSSIEKFFWIVMTAVVSIGLSFFFGRSECFFKYYILYQLQ